MMARMIGEYSEDYLRTRAVEFVKDKTKNSKVLSDEAESRIPRFDPAEITFGRELGRGGFCQVFEVKKVRLNSPVHAPTPPPPPPSNNDNENGNGNDSDSHSRPDTLLQDRHFIATRYIRTGSDKGSRYAVKTMLRTIKEPTRFLGGVMDLAIETRFLAVVRHPNIIKMRAVSDIDPYQDRYFIVLDRLYDTLTQRVAAWKDSRRKMTGFNKVRDLKGDKKKALWIDRLLVAHDICSALRYLHVNRIIYRDLKSDNIGFDVRGDVKLFDFGLAKELDPATELDSSTYELSGRTGSLRYMAPEVASELPYNFSVDVYSFTILLWQICALETPFANLNVQTHFESVVKAGERPELKEAWSAKLGNLMERGWSGDMAERPECGECMEVLRAEVNPFLGDEEVNVLDQSSRTQASLDGL